MPVSGEAVRTVAADVLFDGFRITPRCIVSLADGRVESVTGPQPAEVYAGQREQADRASCFVAPGLVDAHVHVTGYREGIPAGNPYEPAKNFLRLCLLHGVTTVRDTGNSLEALAFLREWTEKYGGPRIVGAGPMLDTPPFTWPFTRIVRDEASARRQVRLLAAEGVDFIKAYRNVDAPLLRAIVRAADAEGLPVVVDCGRVGTDEACEAGVTSVEHAVTLAGAAAAAGACCGDASGAAAAMRAWKDIDVHGDRAKRLRGLFLHHGVTLVPTFLVSRRWTFFDEMVAEPTNSVMASVMPYHRHFEHMRGPVGARIGRRLAGRYMPVQALDKHEVAEASEGFERMKELVALLHSDGVRIAVGTDAPNPSITPGASVHWEVAELVRAGFEPVAALRAATSQAADLLGLTDVGRVTPGARADLILLAGDPTEDIRNIRRLNAVMRGGAMVDTARIERLINEAVNAA